MNQTCERVRKVPKSADLIAEINPAAWTCEEQYFTEELHFDPKSESYYLKNAWGSRATECWWCDRGNPITGDPEKYPYSYLDDRPDKGVWLLSEDGAKDWFLSRSLSSRDSGESVPAHEAIFEWHSLPAFLSIEVHKEGDLYRVDGPWGEVTALPVESCLPLAVVLRNGNPEPLATFLDFDLRSAYVGGWRRWEERVLHRGLWRWVAETFDDPASITIRFDPGYETEKQETFPAASA